MPDDRTMTRSEWGVFLSDLLALAAPRIGEPDPASVDALLRASDLYGVRPAALGAVVGAALP